MKLRNLIALALLLCAGAAAQTAAPAPQAKPTTPQAKPAMPNLPPAPAQPLPVLEKPPSGVITESFIPLPPDLHGKARDLQFAEDQLEISIQKMLVEVEQDKQKKRDLEDQERALYFDFMQAHGLSLDEWQVDKGQMAVTKQKAKPEQPWQ
jgi:hypothetical protein